MTPEIKEQAESLLKISAYLNFMSIKSDQRLTWATQEFSYLTKHIRARDKRKSSLPFLIWIIMDKYSQ